MSRRADRLFEIIQVLRRAKAPLTAESIATELETSKRTIYRDITALMAQRVPIRGEAGIGYVLERGFDCPPLMLTADELEAVALGAQWVIAHGDNSLAHAAVDVLTKVAAIVPAHLRPYLEHPAVGVPPTDPKNNHQPDSINISKLRRWSRNGLKLNIHYIDQAGNTSKRTVWPFMVGYVTGTQALMAWCEIRENFRLFRTDRITSTEYLEQRYPAHPFTLRQRWLTLHAASKVSQK